MIEKPILFNTEMVKAILDGRKTQTRRVIKNICGNYDEIRANPCYHGAWNPIILGRVLSGFKCPYGNAGDKLWVRETWKVQSFSPDYFAICYKADGSHKELEDVPKDFSYLQDKFDDWQENLAFQSEKELEKMKFLEDENSEYRWVWKGESPLRWRPSIYLPRWASRINLRITDVRIERLQRLTYENAIAEGILHRTGEILGIDWYAGYIGAEWRTDPIIAFRDLWDSINGKRGYGWNKNPWVWVVEFEAVE